MREFIRDWRTEWIDTNGLTEDLEVVIKDKADSENEIYVGSFMDIPPDLLDYRVYDMWKIAESSDPQRVGAYMLYIVR